jgi:AraC family L-rhamnose operon transcriptional activator RhaR
MIRKQDLYWKETPVYVNRFEENFTSSYHAHDFIEIAYISEGKGYHHIGDQVHAVSKGDVCVLPIGVQHVFRPASAHRDQRLVVYNCVFTEGLLEHLTGQVIVDLDLGTLLTLQPDGRNDHGYWISDRQLSFEPLFLSMYEEYSINRNGSSAVLYALLIQLLVMLHRKTYKPAAQLFQPEDPLVEAIDYIHAHASEPLSIRTLADLCKLSERHFFRLFKQRTGQTFHTFVQHTRIRSACELLQCTSQKIGAISEAVGYADAESFYRVFKRIVGMTPGMYRKQQSKSG